MPTSEGGTDPSDGGGSRSYLLISDLHLFRDDIDRDEVVDSIVEYGSAYDCDDILVAGDIGEFDAVEDILDGNFQTGKAVEGNHDDWSEYIEDEVNETLMADGGNLEYGERLDWEEDIDQAYRVAMSHKPHDFGIRGQMADTSEHEMEDYDIVIYGHSHMPYYRVIDGKLAIGAGSTFRNYNTATHMPDQSVMVLEFDDGITIKHIDFESGELVEESRYRRTPAGFEETDSLWRWHGEHDDRFR